METTLKNIYLYYIYFPFSYFIPLFLSFLQFLVYFLALNIVVSNRYTYAHSIPTFAVSYPWSCWLSPLPAHIFAHLVLIWLTGRLTMCLFTVSVCVCVNLNVFLWEHKTHTHTPKHTKKTNYIRKSGTTKMQTIETETNKTHLGIVNLYGFMETGSVFFVAMLLQLLLLLLPLPLPLPPPLSLLLLLFYYCCSWIWKINVSLVGFLNMHTSCMCVLVAVSFASNTHSPRMATIIM